MTTAARRSAASLLSAAAVALLLVGCAKDTDDAAGAAPAETAAIPAATAPPTEDSLAPITASAPVELVVPHADPALEVQEEVLADDGPCDPIDPPTNDAYYCTDAGAGAQLPGTDSTDLTFLAGHSLRDPSRDSPFNRIDRMGEELVGNEVYVRTESSGDQWLVYSVEERIQIDQDDLAYSEEIWGDADGTPLPGRMLLVTCHQTGDLVHSTDNTILVAQLADVVDQADVDAALAA